MSSFGSWSLCGRDFQQSGAPWSHHPWRIKVRKTLTKNPSLVHECFKTGKYCCIFLLEISKWIRNLRILLCSRGCWWTAQDSSGGQRVPCDVRSASDSSPEHGRERVSCTHNYVGPWQVAFMGYSSSLKLPPCSWGESNGVGISMSLPAGPRPLTWQPLMRELTPNRASIFGSSLPRWCSHNATKSLIPLFSQSLTGFSLSTNDKMMSFSGAGLRGWHSYTSRKKLWYSCLDIGSQSWGTLRWCSRAEQAAPFISMSFSLPSLSPPTPPFRPSNSFLTPKNLCSQHPAFAWNCSQALVLDGGKRRNRSCFLTLIFH